MTKLKHNSEYIQIKDEQRIWLNKLVKWLETRGVERDYPILIWEVVLDVTINQPYSLCFKALLNDRYHKDDKDKLNWLQRLYHYTKKWNLNWKGKHLYDVYDQKVVVNKNDIILMLGKYNSQDKE